MEDGGPPFICPCCGFPSLQSWATAVCDICWWQVDLLEAGDPEDRVSCGPNRGYSLRHARANFLHHGHKFDLDRQIPYLEHPTESRVELMTYVHAVQAGRIALDVERLTELVRAEAQTVIAPPETEAAEQEQAQHEEALLRALLATPKTD